MIPSFEYTKKRDKAWFLLVEGAQAIADFCNIWFISRGLADDFEASIESDGNLACIVVDHGDFRTYIKHPAGF